MGVPTLSHELSQRFLASVSSLPPSRFPHSRTAQQKRVEAWWAPRYFEGRSQRHGA